MSFELPCGIQRTAQHSTAQRSQAGVLQESNPMRRECCKHVKEQGRPPHMTSSTLEPWEGAEVTLDEKIDSGNVTPRLCGPRQRCTVDDLNRRKRPEGFPLRPVQHCRSRFLQFLACILCGVVAENRHHQQCSPAQSFIDTCPISPQCRVGRPPHPCLANKHVSHKSWPSVSFVWEEANCHVCRTGVVADMAKP